MQVAATLLDEWSNVSRLVWDQPECPFVYDVRKPLVELTQQLIQYISELMEVPVQNIRLEDTLTRLQLIHFLATELEACKLYSANRETVSEQSRDVIYDIPIRCTSCHLSNYWDPLAVLLKTKRIQDTKEAKTCIRRAKERIINDSHLFPTNTTKYLQEYLSVPSHWKEMQEIHRLVYFDYKKRRELLITRFQASVECFQSSERWTSWKHQPELPIERMFCVYDLYGTTRQQLVEEIPQ